MKGCQFTVSLEAARVNRNISQVEAAKRLGVNANTLRHWEHGSRSPRYEHVVKMTEIYDVPLELLRF